MPCSSSERDRGMGSASGTGWVLLLPHALLPHQLSLLTNNHPRKHQHPQNSKAAATGYLKPLCDCSSKTFRRALFQVESFLDYTIICCRHHRGHFLIFYLVFILKPKYTGGTLDFCPQSLQAKDKQSFYFPITNFIHKLLTSSIS